MPIEGTISRFSEGTNTLLRCERPCLSWVIHVGFKREVAREQPMKFLLWLDRHCLFKRAASAAVSRDRSFREARI